MDLQGIPVNVWAGIIILAALLFLMLVRRGFRGLVVEVGE